MGKKLIGSRNHHNSLPCRRSCHAIPSCWGGKAIWEAIIMKKRKEKRAEKVRTLDSLRYVVVGSS